MLVSVIGVLLAAGPAAVEPAAGSTERIPISSAQEQRQYLSARDLLAQPPIPADHRISFGEDPSNFGDLRLPDGAGPHPVAVLIHGGCWMEFADLRYLDRLAVALTGAGVATWNIEYRRIDMEGGGWPNTFLDVALGVDHVRELARQYPLDLERVVMVGHSAGGHLALWAAGRHRIPEKSVLYAAEALPIVGAVSLGGVPELRRFREKDPPTCGEGAVDRLMGGGPREVPDRYRAGSPFQLLPLEVAQRHITGRDDQAVPPDQVRLYNYESQSAGDDSELIVVPNAAHFEVVWPESDAWPIVEEAVLSLLGVSESD